MRFFSLKSSSIISWWLIFCVCSVSSHAAVAADDSDKLVLLELKTSLSDPSGLLASWNLSSDYCSAWFGVSCDSNSRVSSLNVTGDGAKGTERLFFCDDSAQFPIYGYGFRRSCAGSDGKLAGKLLSSVAKLTELRILALPFNELYGQLPSEIWGMEKLEVLDLEGNQFSGSIPVHFLGLKSLQVLNLGFNNISGELPSSMLNLVNLEVLNLAGNSLNGSLPQFVGLFNSVYLSFNQFTGSIPGEIGKNCGKLEHLDLSGNFLGGQIPSTIGSCSRLKSLLLYSNMLEERVTPAIGLLQRLEVLDVSRNTLSGSIPMELGNCTNLSILVLSNLLDPLQGFNISKSVLLEDLKSMNDEFNYFQGNLPAEITNLPNLKILWAPRANFEGRLPSNWGLNLEMINLRENYFTGIVPAQLGACSKLSFLDLSSNKLSGKLSEQIQVPCMSLFDVGGNSLSGSIPNFRISNCVPNYNPSGTYLLSLSCKAEVGFSFCVDDDTFVFYHNFQQNSFNGTLSSLPITSTRIGNKKKTVYAFLAGENNLSGSFSGAILENCYGFDSIFVNISYNKISGSIEQSGLGTTSCGSNIFLDASRNWISGPIPEILRLVALNLSWNSLVGPIPSGLSRVTDLAYLSLAGNRLNGSIPSNFGRLESLQSLDLSSNSLSGEIPSELLRLRKLGMLLLNNNRLSGQLPPGLTNMTLLTSFNVSFNNLSGPLPLNNLLRCDSIRGNHFTSPCMYSVSIPSGDPQNYSASTEASGGNNGKNSFNSIEIASIVSASAIVFVLILLIILFVYTRWWPSRREFGSVKKEVTVFEEIRVQLTYETVVRATGFFNSSNCIGSGGFGATYKAEISQGLLLAIKRLAVGRFQGIQQFHAEIKTLGRLRHPNLVTLIGYHASETEMFLIYNYLPGGNLEKFIQDRPTRPVNWQVLHKIAIDIARALAYLHDQCVPRVLHRDVKPSNILLDDDHNAYLSDFGLARLLGTSETHATTGVAGTFGYVAPEYAMTCRVSDKADVYSYGVVLLELLSDKKALDPSFSSYGNGFNIVAWACMLLRQGRAKEFFTPGLWEVAPHDDLVDVLHLAVVCTVDSLTTRPTMKQVAHRLKKLQPP